MKFNLIIDGNGFMHKCISLHDGISGKKMFFPEKETKKVEKILYTTFLSEINKFKPFIDKIVLVQDSRSWRYEFYEKYKGNRKVKEDIHWDNYVTVYTNFYKKLESSGVILSKIDSAEGDDLIYSWVNKFKIENEPTVILASDRDLLQLLGFNRNWFSILIDSRSETIFGTKTFYEKLDKKHEYDKIVSFFDISKPDEDEIDDNLKATIKSLLKKGYKFTPVDIDKFLFRKILEGDSGDNIKSAFHVLKNEKTYGIGEKSLDILTETFSKNSFSFNDFYDLKKINVISEVVYKYMKKIDKQDLVTKEDVINNINLNLKLMVLNDKFIPQNLQDNMNSDIEFKYSNSNSFSFKLFDKIFNKEKEELYNSLF